MNKNNLKDKGNNYYKNGDYAMAIAMYRKYVEKQHDDNKNAYYNMGLCFYRLERYDQCVDICKKALQIDQNYSKVYYRIALAYEKLGKPYKCYLYANKFCDKSQSRKGEDFEEMKKLRDTMRDTIILPNPVVKEEKHYFFKSDFEQKEGGSGMKKDERERQQFKGYSWKDVEKTLNNGQINQAINQGYGISRKSPTSDIKMRVNKQNMKILKDAKKGKIGVPIRLKDENEVKLQLNQEKEAKNQSQILVFKKQQDKQIKQVIATEVNENKIEQESKTTLYQKYFLVPLEKKIDIFQGFFSTIIQIVQNKKIGIGQKEKILNEAKETYPMFQVLQMSLSDKQKKELKAAMQQQKISVPLIGSFCE